MFKNLKIIQNKFAKIFELLNNCAELDKELKNETDKYFAALTDFSEDLNGYLLNASERNKTVKMFNNQKTLNNNSYLINHQTIPFSDVGFEKSLLGCFSSKVSNVMLQEDYNLSFNESGNICTVSFDELITLNNISFDFKDLDGNQQIPKQILIGDIDGKSIFEPWMKKISRSGLTKDLANTFSFTLTSTNKITFVFENKISTKPLLSFSKKNYSESSELIFKIPYSGFKNFAVLKNDFTEQVKLDYFYSLDNLNWSSLMFFDNNMKPLDNTIVSLKEKYNGDDFFVKVVRSETNDNLFKKEKSLETEVIELKENKINDISFGLSIPVGVTTFDLIVDAEVYNIFKEKNVVFVDKTPDGLFLINSDKITKIKEIDALKTLKLKNQNDFTVYDSSFLPNFYLTESGKLYMPQCFALKDFSVVYEKEIEKTTISASDFTPYLFSLELNFDN